MVTSAMVRILAPRVSALVHRATASGPAMAVSIPSWWLTHGIDSP